MAKRDQPDQGWREHVLNTMLPRNEATSTEQATGFQPAPANPPPLSFGGVHVRPDFDVIELLPERCGRTLALRLPLTLVFHGCIASNTPRETAPASQNRRAARSARRER